MNVTNVLNEAVSLHQQGQFTEALALYQRILSKKPKNSDALHLSGVIYLQSGNYSKAQSLITKAIKVTPGQANFHNNLGLCYKNQQRKNLAIKHFKTAISLHPDYPEALNNLGITLKEDHQYDQAKLIFDQILQKNPVHAEALTNLATIHKEEGNIPVAIDGFRRALEIDPNLLEALTNLGILEINRGELHLAHDAFLRAHQLKPDDTDTITTLGNIYIETGQLQAAIDWYQKGLVLDPENGFLQSNYLFALNYHPTMTQQEIYQAYKTWGGQFNQNDNSLQKFRGHDYDPDKKLNIAYLSGDLRSHSATNFIQPVLQHHDKNLVTLFAYSTARIHDETSDQLKTLFDHWHEVYSLDDNQVLNQILDDKIDILVDLCGHTKGQRLSVLASKAAPIQVTWIGYGYTTGLSQVDYFLANEQFVPIQDQQFFTESVYYLEGVPFCFKPPESAPQSPYPPPANKNGYITFGCMSRPVRINHKVIQCWSDLINSVKDARLRLDHPAFKNADAREYYSREFSRHGVSGDQIQFASTQPHWEAFREIDVILDPFPHNSGTTTLESLWMGVPVITKKDRAPLGRFGDLLVSETGYPEWVAESEHEYIQIAQRFAKNMAHLGQQRAQIHTSFRQSRLMDSQLFTKQLENAYTSMWHNLCRKIT